MHHLERKIIPSMEKDQVREWIDGLKVDGYERVREADRLRERKGERG